MSLLATPVLLINLLCEMIFVLHQRLQAQNVNQDKSRRVLHDIMHGFTDEAFLTEAFTPQSLCTVYSAKTLFQQLAHVSVMKLNDSR